MRAAISLMTVRTADESSRNMRDGLSKKQMAHIVLLLTDSCGLASGHTSLVDLRLILDACEGLSRNTTADDWRLGRQVTSHIF